VRANDTPQTPGSVETPKSNGGIQVAEPSVKRFLGHKVVVQANNGGDSDENVEKLEGLIEGVSKRAGGLDTEENEGAGGLIGVSNLTKLATS
jgi:hypothetical protein